MLSKKINPWVRVLLLVIFTSSLIVISKIVTGNYLPTNSKESLLFQNALLFIVFGSTLLVHLYTKPVDSVINSLMCFISLIGVYRIAPKTPWLFVTAYCVIVFILGLTCVTISSGKDLTGWKRKIADFTYGPSVLLGKSRIIYSVVFLAGLFFFYSIQDPITLSLIIFWGIYLVIWPLRIPNLISTIGEKHKRHDIIGTIIRIDDPNILRVVFPAEICWDIKYPMICTLPNLLSYWVIPLYSQFQGNKLLATGILTSKKAKSQLSIPNGVVPPLKDMEVPSLNDLNTSLGGSENSTLIGYVKENSFIGSIQIEVISNNNCHEGMFIWANIESKKVYYQIVEGENQEESFNSDKHGYQIAIANQLGYLEENSGFYKYNWVPPMNTPIFGFTDSTSHDKQVINNSDFILGNLPNTNLKIGGDFTKDYNQNTAILGVTGAGKTELAFDLIRFSLANQLKVICIDLTAQYKDRLLDLNPIDLTINEETSNTLTEKLFEVDSGEYGAGKEKKALKEFAQPLRSDVTHSINDFLSTNSSNLGIIRLEEISNTKATLWITELYMTTLLNYARENRSNCPKILIVVEEAHTVMPESSTMGVGGYESKGLVGKIAQIALQGRKYGVGLLVLAQRTATVSKTVLTQCNTIISFACYDDTSINFLNNIYGKNYTKLLPTLPRLNAIAYGPWIKSQNPIVFEIPFDESKR